MSPPPAPLDPRASAADRILSRLLVSLPLAAREEGGVALETLARELGVEPRRLVLDFTEVDGRSWYLHAGLGDQLSVGFDGDRLRAWTRGPFRRPVALTRGEALALVLGIRARSAPDEAERLATRLVAALAAERPDPPPRASGSRPSGPGPAPGSAPSPPGSPVPGGEAVGLPPTPGSGDPVREAAAEALRRGDVLDFRYGGPGRDPEDRHLLPGLLVHAEGSWYLVGRDLDRDAPRVFRCDRILEARVRPREAGVPPLSPEEQARFESFLHPETGRVWMPGPSTSQEEGPPRATIRYSLRIAPWIREHGYAIAREDPDGALEVIHGVEDPDWVVRHVLSYAGEAVVLDPPWLREEVRRGALEAAGLSGHRERQ